MRSPLMPFVLAALMTAMIGIAVRMEPYFAGDVRVTRAFQQAVGQPEWWATPVSRLAPAPGKYYVMAIAFIAAYVVAGWRGLVILAGVLLLEQYAAESTKAWFKRPRPSPDLVTLYGKFGGFTFPSTTITFFSVTFGTVAVLAALSRKAPYRWAIAALSFGMVLLGGAARVALGAHWPSDVLLTALICMTWTWAAARVVLRRG
jgi:membrane-associated phospholipid phosphatase